MLLRPPLPVAPPKRSRPTFQEVSFRTANFAGEICFFFCLCFCSCFCFCLRSGRLLRRAPLPLSFSVIPTEAARPFSSTRFSRAALRSGGTLAIPQRRYHRRDAAPSEQERPYATKFPRPDQPQELSFRTAHFAGEPLHLRRRNLLFLPRSRKLFLPHVNYSRELQTCQQLTNPSPAAPLSSNASSLVWVARAARRAFACTFTPIPASS